MQYRLHRKLFLDAVVKLQVTQSHMPPLIPQAAELCAWRSGHTSMDA